MDAVRLGTAEFVGVALKGSVSVSTGTVVPTFVADGALDMARTMAKTTAKARTAIAMIATMISPPTSRRI
jgi:hypothetical protein